MMQVKIFSNHKHVYNNDVNHALKLSKNNNELNMLKCMLSCVRLVAGSGCNASGRARDVVFLRNTDTSNTKRGCMRGGNSESNDDGWMTP